VTETFTGTLDGCDPGASCDGLGDSHRISVGAAGTLKATATFAITALGSGAYSNPPALIMTLYASGRGCLAACDSLVGQDLGTASPLEVSGPVDPKNLDYILTFGFYQRCGTGCTIPFTVTVEHP
jgi:hypothetical protein